jgi:hypothetical protein
MMKHKTVDGLNIAIANHRRCKVCVEANLRITKVPRTRTRNLQPLEVIGSDLQTMPTYSHDGKKYVAIYVDHQTGFTITVNLSSKNQQEQHTLAVLRSFERKSGGKHRVQTLRADLGGEFTSKQLEKQLRNEGIHQEFADTGMEFQNGLAEVLGGGSSLE